MKYKVICIVYIVTTNAIMPVVSDYLISDFVTCTNTQPIKLTVCAKPIRFKG